LIMSQPTHRPNQPKTQSNQRPHLFRFLLSHLLNLLNRLFRARFQNGGERVSTKTDQLGSVFMPLSTILKKNERLKRAEEFLVNVKAKPNVDYAWTAKFAESLWAYNEKEFVALDEKADSIIKYLGGGTGLFAIGVLSKIDASNIHIALATLPAIISAILSVLIATIVRKPHPVPNLPTVMNAKEAYADANASGTAGLGAFLGQWNLACERMAVVCKWKSKLLETAVWLFFAAIALLLFPLLVGIIWPPVSKPVEY